MDILQKRLSEIRDLRAEELDLVGGAGEATLIWNTMSPSYANIPYMTSSMMQITPGVFSSVTDDGTTQYIQVDTSYD